MKIPVLAGVGDELGEVRTSQVKSTSNALNIHSIYWDKGAIFILLLHHRIHFNTDPSAALDA